MFKPLGNQAGLSGSLVDCFEEGHEDRHQVEHKSIEVGYKKWN